MAKMRPVQFPISLLKASAIIGKGTAFDLSADGCAMESQTNLQAGDYVALQLYLPHQEAPTTPLKVDVAAVRWTSQRKVGLEFIQMPSAEQARLRRFLKSLETTSR